jgi:hypothetical protein
MASEGCVMSPPLTALTPWLLGLQIIGWQREAALVFQARAVLVRLTPERLAAQYWGVLYASHIDVRGLGCCVCPGN